MVLDVLLYKNTSNPYGYPEGWPAKVIEREDDAAKPKKPWVRMTLEKYNALREDPELLEEANAVSAARKNARKDAKRKAKEDKKAELQAILTKVQDGEASNAELSALILALAKKVNL